MAATGELSAKQKRFADEYLIDLNATAAYKRAGYVFKNEGVATAASSRLLANVKVCAYIAKRMQERAERTEITQDMVLQRWWAIANADPRKLIAYHRGACRHCHGVGHAYQWINEAEYIAAVASSEEDAPPPLNDGGYGFNPTRLPHHECPKCFGRGYGEAIASDTRSLPDDVALLYAGVKVTKDGLEIKMQDQGKALENVARHLGMFNDNLRLTGAGGGPIQAVCTIERRIIDPK